MRDNTYMAVDQYGQTYHGLTRPRRDLCDRLGRKHVDKMYIDTKAGESRHCGYIIGGLWLSVYEVKGINV
jgi:hypothetical protein